MTLFQTLVRSGVNQHCPPHRVEEVKLLNSVSLHGILLIASFSAIASVSLPEHRLFVLSLSLTEVIAKSCVVLLHNVQRYAFAKYVFAMVTLLVLLIAIAYCGLDSGFQHLGLTVLFGMFFMFKNGNKEDFALITLFSTVGLLVLTFFYLNEQPSLLHSDELDGMRILTFTFNGALVITLGTIFFKSNRARSNRANRTFEQVKSVANILNSISDNINDAIYKTRVDKGFVYVNPAFAKIFGFIDEEQVMRLHPEDMYASAKDRIELLKELKGSGAVSLKLMKFKRNSGLNFWGRLSARIIDEDGEQFIVGTITDVSQQQELDAQVKENEAQLSEAFQIAKMGNWSLDLVRKELHQSPESEALHGAVETKLSYQEWVNRLENLSAAQVEALVAKAMMAHETVDFSSWFNSPDGRRRFLNYRGRFKRLGDQRGGHWLGTVLDSTEQKMAELRTVEARNLYESMLDLLPFEVVLFDEEGRFVYISRGAISDDELRRWLIGKTNDDYAHYRHLDPAFGAQRMAMHRKAMQTNAPVEWNETMTDRAGTERRMRRRILPFQYQRDGRTEHLVIGYSISLADQEDPAILKLL